MGWLLEYYINGIMHGIQLVGVAVVAGVAGIVGAVVLCVAVCAVVISTYPFSFYNKDK